MHIAVLIGITDYKVAARLPACSKDVAEMQRLLLATKKYADICCISSKTDAGPLKETLRDFFARYQSSGPVQEALVYFSGHGAYHNDVLLCCSDFDPNRPASTSISNAEIDDLLRSVSPDVAVKILDACQSGSPYIKDAAPGFEKALRESRLKSFICMASSRADQASYATIECSLFTSRLIEAALSKTEGVVLYRDVHAALADAFVATPEQTPFFVIQGTGLEAFAPVTPEMRALQSARSASQTSVKAENSIVARIAEEVQRMDTLYVSPETASQAIQQVGKDLDQVALSNPLVAHFYDKRVTFDLKLATLPGGQAVAQFAEAQGWEKKYFVEIVRAPHRVKVLKNPFAALKAPFRFGEAEDADYIFKTVQKPVRLESTQALPVEVAQVRFEPKGYPSLKTLALYIGVVHSLTELVVLSAIARLAEAGWTERSVDVSQLKWHHQAHLWKDVVQRPGLIWEEALTRGQDTVGAYLQGLVPKKDEQKPGDSAEPQPGAGS